MGVSVFLATGGPKPSFLFVRLNAKVKKLTAGFPCGFTVVHDFFLFCWRDTNMDPHAPHFFLRLGRPSRSGRQSFHLTFCVCNKYIIASAKSQALFSTFLCNFWRRIYGLLRIGYSGYSFRYGLILFNFSVLLLTCHAKKCMFMLFLVVIGALHNRRLRAVVAFVFFAGSGDGYGH